MEKLQLIKRKVVIEGTRPIMFDRYPGDNKKELQPDQKCYLNENKEIVLPAINILSFLCAENTKSAVKMFYDKREYKDVAQAILGSVCIDPEEILITRDGKTPIVFDGFKDGEIELRESVARLAKGIPNPKKRPLLFLPWQMSFDVSMIKNDHIDEEGLRNLFEKGGLMIGFGTFRGVFGKFKVVNWK